MTLLELKNLIADKKFSHAHYLKRQIWHGLMIYAKADNGWGFRPVGFFDSKDPNLIHAAAIAGMDKYVRLDNVF